MNSKSIYLISIVVIIVISLGVLISIPLIPVKEEYGAQTFTIDDYESVTTTLFVKKGWTISGQFSSICNYGNGEYGECKDLYKGENIYPIIQIYAPNGETVIYEENGVSSDTFIFVSVNGGGYRIVITYPDQIWTSIYNPPMDVTIDAEQTGKGTILDLF